MKKFIFTLLFFMLCAGTLIGAKASAKSQVKSEAKSESAAVKEGDFYFAYFDVNTKDNVKVSISNLILRFHGTIEKINPADLTDVVLTKDGIAVDNQVTLSDRVEQSSWRYEEITDFYFSFEKEIKEVGNYGLTGKFKGETFTVYNKIIEAPVSKKPALAKNLISVNFCYLTDENNKPKSVSEVSFTFKGRQNTFYVSNLKELKLTLDGKEIPFSFTKNVFRYYEFNGTNMGDTSYNLILKDDLTKAGTYCLTGKYRGKTFKSSEITIPGSTAKEIAQVSTGTNDDKATSDDDKATSKEGEFYLAFLDRLTEDNRIVSITGMFVRFYGHIDSVKLSDFTNVTLKKDGIVIKNDIKLVGTGKQSQFLYEDVTDFYFEFQKEIVEPGLYTLTGEYQGKTFNAGTVIIEKPLSDTPADGDDLSSVSWCYFTDKNEDIERIGEVSFHFKGLQNQFNLSDLTDCKLTLNGKKIAFEVNDQAMRYYESTGINSSDTSFNLILKHELTKPGTYCLTGYYQGKQFTSMEITIPK